MVKFPRNEIQHNIQHFGTEEQQEHRVYNTSYDQQKINNRRNT